MSPDDPSTSGPPGRDPYAAPDGDSSQRYPRAELRRKVSLKFKEFQGFVNEYSENVSAGGMFIRTSSPQPVGTVFDFEFTLGDDYTLIHGLGEVVWVRERDEGFDRPPGMGVRFLSLDPGSRKLIDRMVAERLARGGEVTGPSPGAAPPPPSGPRPFVLGDDPPFKSTGVSDLDDTWRDDDVDEDDDGTYPVRTVAVGAGALSAVDGSADEPAGDEAPRSLWRDDDPVVDWGNEDSFDSGPAGETEAGYDADGEHPAAGASEEPARPRSSGPSPYIYTRSTTSQGAGYSRGGDRSRTVLITLVILVALVAAAAAFALFGPGLELPGWLGGGGDDGTLVARQADGGEDAPGRPVEPVDPEGVERARPLTPPPATDDAGAVDDAGEDEGELGFFGEERRDAAPEEVEPAPEPTPPSATDAEPEPEPVPEPEPASPVATDAPFSRVLNVTYDDRGAVTLVTVHLDGAIEEWSYSSSRLGDPPRELVRIDGVDRPFARPTIPVGTALVDRVRLGFHPEGRTSQMHVVIDLASPDARLDRSEAVGSDLRLWITSQPE